MKLNEPGRKKFRGKKEARLCPLEEARITIFQPTQGLKSSKGQRLTALGFQRVGGRGGVISATRVPTVGKLHVTERLHEETGAGRP